MILEYIMKFHLQECINILSERDIFEYYSIKIDFLKLFEAYPDVGDNVLCNPVESLSACNNDIVKAQRKILDEDDYKPLLLKLDYCHLKQNVYARFFGLPVCPELHRTIFPKNVDLGCFLKVTGTVVRVTQSKMLEYQRKYVCMKCKYENIVQAEFEHRYVLKAPSKCRNEETRCRSGTFTQVNLVSREHCKDYQEIKIQELVNKLSIGTIPDSMWVVLEDDLVDCCKPGDDVNICGTVRRRWRPSIHNKKCEVELVLQANYVEVCNTQRSEVIATAPDVKECFNEFWSNYEACPLKGRDHILASVSPQVYGLHLVKLALLLTVITGSNHIAESEVNKQSSRDDHITRVRGQCHLLLVGDPGTGKSQLLRAGSELTARSVFTSGAGSTRAGLTCSALREEGEWQLEAGALVLSDGGVCCIDEISQLREHDRTAIHEAMEQQTISVAKAGIVCKLNTRCAIIAACNPKGHYQTDQPLSVNVSLGTPLLSRFDLIFILLDTKNETWDKLVSSYILFGDSNSNETKKQWSIEKLQMYISFVGPRQTQMTKSANTILQSYYMTQRRSECRDPSRTTVRMLDSLVRLSQAHCRLMYRNTILPIDAVTAVSLVDLSMQDCTLSDTVDALHSTFQKYPDFEYLRTAKKLFTRLTLCDIWQEELLRYAKLLQVDHKTLESEIEKNSYQMFVKYDDVGDDNIPLSASIITSSYFNNKEVNNYNQQNNDLECMNDKNSFDKENNEDVNKKLAATLKKHAMLNKNGRKPPGDFENKQSVKRKRNEVVVNISSFRSKNEKTKKRNMEPDSSVDYNFNSDEETIDTSAILNAVPSVNDVFTELKIDFKYINDTENHDDEKHTALKKTQSKERKSDKESKPKKINENGSFNNTTTRTNPEVVKTEDNKCKEKFKDHINTISKLKQFQFVEKHDLSKFYEEKSKKQCVNNTTVVKLENLEEGSNDNSNCIRQKSTVSNSQISIFESSDCDIDLDNL